jgi:REP element-mobilizing transposase RayT
MENKFQNKFRIPSARLQNWDYASQGAYFITICSKDRVHYFGEIKNKKMILSKLGTIVEMEWLKTIELRPDMNLEMGEYKVMPNHFHAIIIIGNNKYNAIRTDAIRRDAMHGVSTNGNNDYKNHFASQSKNIASIIRGFKSSVTTFARKNEIEFAWQPRFHDHIIRDAQSFENIQNYIANNPINWDKDKLYGNE